MQRSLTLHPRVRNVSASLPGGSAADAVFPTVLQPRKNIRGADEIHTGSKAGSSAQFGSTDSKEKAFANAKVEWTRSSIELLDVI